jgi:hypothetical protein
MVKTRRPFPVGIPVRPPPDWRPRTARPRRRAPRSPFAGPLGLVLKVVLVSLLVIVCMGIGWLLTQGRRPERTVAQAPVKKRTKAPQRPLAMKKQEEPPAPKEDPPAPKEEPPPKQPAPKVEPPVPQPPPRDPLTFERDILPLLRESCFRCHGVQQKKGRLDVRTYTALMKGGKSGPGVVPGKPDESPLYESIASGSMPPSNRKFEAANLERIREWILQGARSERDKR